MDRWLLIVLTSLLAITGCVDTFVPDLDSIQVVGPPDGVTVIGESTLFSAFASFSDGVRRDITLVVVWTSTDVSVVTVSAAGEGQAVGTGESAVCASYEGVTGCLMVTVTEAP